MHVRLDVLACSSAASSRVTSSVLLFHRRLSIRQHAEMLCGEAAGACGSECSGRHYNFFAVTALPAAAAATAAAAGLKVADAPGGVGFSSSRTTLPVLDVAGQLLHLGDACHLVSAYACMCMLSSSWMSYCVQCQQTITA